MTSKLKSYVHRIIIMGSYVLVFALVLREMYSAKMQGVAPLFLYYTLVGLVMLLIMAMLQIILLDMKAKLGRVSSRLIVLESATYALIVIIVGIVLLFPVGAQGSVNVGYAYGTGAIASSVALIVVLVFLMRENRKQMVLEKLYRKIEKIATKKFESSSEIIIIDDENLYIPEKIAKELSLGISGIVSKRDLMSRLDKELSKEISKIIEGVGNLALVNTERGRLGFIRKEDGIEVVESDNIVGMARLGDNDRPTEICGESFVESIMDLWSRTLSKEGLENILEYRGKIYIIRKKDPRTVIVEESSPSDYLVLSVSEGLVRALDNLKSIGICFCKDEKITYLNDSFIGLLGINLRKDEVLGKNIWSVLPPEVSQRILDLLPHVITMKEAPQIKLESKRHDIRLNAYMVIEPFTKKIQIMIISPEFEELEIPEIFSDVLQHVLHFKDQRLKTITMRAISDLSDRRRLKIRAVVSLYKVFSKVFGEVPRGIPSDLVELDHRALSLIILVLVCSREYYKAKIERVHIKNSSIIIEYDESGTGLLTDLIEAINLAKANIPPPKKLALLWMVAKAIENQGYDLIPNPESRTLEIKSISMPT